MHLKLRSFCLLLVLLIASSGIAQEPEHPKNNFQLSLFGGYNLTQSVPLLGGGANYEHRFGKHWAFTSGLNWDYSRITLSDGNGRFKPQDVHEFDLNIGAKYYVKQLSLGVGISPIGMGGSDPYQYKNSVRAFPIKFSAGYRLPFLFKGRSEVIIQNMGIVEAKVGVGLRYSIR